MKTRSKKKKQQANTMGIIIFFVLVILFVVIIVVLPTVQTKKLSYGATIPFTPVPAKPNLQMEWFLVPTTTLSQSGGASSQQTIKSPVFSPVPVVKPKTPPPAGPNPATCAGYVNSGVPVPANCDCPGVYLICPFTKSDPTDVTVGPNGCEDPLFVGSPPAKGKFCIDKPVLYLYPVQPTVINVSVSTTGHVTVSDPIYPTGGWKNILAQPEGTLLYQGKTYSELFYETSVTQFAKPDKGILLPMATISTKLSQILTQLGLVGSEKQEFLAYWIPRLTDLHAPYIYFSILTPSSKAAIDSLTITPKPRTFIDFIAYFKPVSHAAPISELILPKAQKRIGFTAVEWGGVIDN